MATTQRIVFGLALACLLPLWSGPALALDPALDLSQYGHTAWKVHDGFTASRVESFAQTADGYLWLGTGSGLVRFDGVRTTPWQPPPGQSLPDNRIRALLGSRDGSLWIGTLQGLARWDGRALHNFPEFDDGYVDSLVQDREGTVWASGVSSSKGLLCAIRDTGSECTGDDGRFGPYVTSVYEDRKGTLWLAAANGLWRWKPGPPTLFTPPTPLTGGLQLVSETTAGAILVVTQSGILQFAGGKFEPLPLQTASPQINLLRDRDGGIWIGTPDGGLFHLHDVRLDSFGISDGLSGVGAGVIFEDREGTVWAATQEGVDRFRALPATTYSAGQGLSGRAGPVLADRDGGVWAATTTGIYRWRDRRLSVYRGRSSSTSLAPAQRPAIEEIVVEGLAPTPNTPSLLQDRNGRLWLGSPSGFGYLKGDRFISIAGMPTGLIVSIVEDKQGNVWVAHGDAGLLRVSPDLKIERVKWPNTGKAGDWWRLAPDPIAGGLWLGSFAGGIVHLVDGMVHASYSAADGLGKGEVDDIRVAADGTVWVGTDGGLSRIKGGRVATLSSRNGLPCDGVNASIEDDEGATWLYTGCGLVRIAPAELEAWGAAMDQGKSAPSVTVTVLGNGDGVRSLVPPGGSSTPHLAKARDGKLWFVTTDGLTTVDPKHLSTNTLPPPVHVEQLIADRKAYVPSGPLSLPPLVRDLTIDYTALSFVAPEKMLFRYKLEGRDRDWEDAGNRRQAFYTDLAPGDYRFRVIASNNSGVWNEDGATLVFSIAPAYWQTNWFLALCATALLALLFGLYQFRMRQLVRAAALTQERHLELAHAYRLATMGQLTASIAHEVNQPLGAAVTNAQAALHWLKAAPPDLEEVRQSLDAIVLAGFRASDIVMRIRSLVKKTPVELGDVFLNDEIMGVLTITHSEALKHEVAVRRELAPDLPFVKGDRVQLQQVLLNLIVNAIEAMSTLPDETRDLLILSEPDGGGGAIVSVCDTGPGLAPADLARIFEPFVTSKKTGLGLGLSICHSIIEAHGGRMWVSENTPRGLVFHFTVPAPPHGAN